MGNTNTYKIFLMNFIPSLICLDGLPIAQRQKRHDQWRAGYTAIFSEVISNITEEKSRVELNCKRLSDGLSVVDHGSDIYDDSANTDEVDSCEGDIPSTLPWRKPPFPLPRPWKGRELFSSTTKSLKRSSSAGRSSRSVGEFTLVETGDGRVSMDQRLGPRESHKWQSPG